MTSRSHRPVGRLVGVPRDWIAADVLHAFDEIDVAVVPFDAGQRLDEIDDIGRIEALACDRAISGADMGLMSSMRLLSFRGTGVADYVDLDEARRRGIAVANVRDYASVDVAELAVGLMLAALRSIPLGDRTVRSGGWKGAGPWGRRLAGLRLGLIGYGVIGREVARLGSALGLKVVYCSTGSDVGSSVARPVALPDLLQTSDIISLHATLSARTRGLIGRSELAQMKPDAIVVNTARGALVDTDALVDALRSCRLGGAALDVFDVEPLSPTSPLLGLDNVILTPHVGASSMRAIEAVTRGCLENIVRFIAGDPQNLVVTDG